jgi:hypothetical protein
MDEIKDENAEPVPPCAPDVCAKVRSRIDRICKANNWPPGYKVLLFVDEKVCFCECW